VLRARMAIAALASVSSPRPLEPCVPEVRKDELMTRKLVLEGWNGYRHQIMPAECGPVQVEETRRAFYAGAIHLFHSLNTILDADREPTDKDLAQVTAIQKEFEDYARDLFKHHAAPDR
jgi:hypothetical protein